MSPVQSEIIKLPAPVTTGGMSLADAITKRRSVRELDTAALTWAEIGQLLWSAQGITGADGLRASPSAGALYPIELYVATNEGVFHYRPATHEVVRTGRTDVRAELRKASLDQGCMQAPCVVAFTAVSERVTAKYPEVGDICVKLEVGHAMQNLLLQVVALGLSSVPVAAFDPPTLGRILQVSHDQEVMYLAPVGRG